ncbi:MAG: enoyl-CoA hydratase/isomerase family protein [Pseudomonadota bacterium]
MGSALLIGRDDRGVATLTLNRPELHNAFDDALIAELTAALERVEGEAGVRAVVLAANGKSFSAGADLDWMKRMADYSEAENLRDAEALAGLMRTLRFLAKPTVAAVQGPAYAGGLGLIAACDIAVAVEGALFAVTEVRFGLVPGAISPYLVAAMGERAAQRYFLTAERFDANQARRLGLVHEVVKAEELGAAVKRLLDALLEGSPAAQAASKDLIRRVARAEIDDALIADTARRIARARASPAGREGISAFLDKRKPDWRA